MKRQSREEYTGIENPTLTFIKSQIIPHSQLTDQQNFRYYEQYKKLLQTAFCIQKKIQELIQKKQTLHMNLMSQQKMMNKKLNQFSKHEEESDTRPKRHRRTNEEIEKKYKCHHEKCQKVYGTQGSLQQHIRLKHMVGSQKNRLEIKA